MSDEFLDAFVRESEENIVDLNNALLDLEDDPSDREAIDLVFRTAHTLKGNFAAMGFGNAAELAHVLEDLLDEIRQDRVAVTPSVMDHLFDGIDDIESAVREIERSGDTSIDPAGTVEALRELLDGDQGPVSVPEAEDASKTDEGGNDTIGGSADPAIQALIDDEAELPDSGVVYRVRVDLEASEMKGVDGMLVLQAVADEYELLGSGPDRDAIEDGEYDGGFDLLVGTSEDTDVETFLDGLSTVDASSVEDVTHALSARADESSDSSGGGDDDQNASVNSIRSVRVDVEQLDELYSLVEQLVTSRIKLRRSVGGSDDRGATGDLDELDKITTNLQNTVMDMRLIPLRKVVNTFPRLVRDVARDLEKEVDFGMTGTDVELDRTILDEISDPLMHILRNSVDHGIERPDVREAAGKSREGTVRLHASRERDHVEVVVEDDGAGLDADAIREVAMERDVLTEQEIEAMADEAVYDLIFHPGFSTSEEVTDVSGRGVGMDVVHSTVERLDGSVSVSSTPGEGTTVTLRLPISVAIVRVLFVQVADRVFGLPIKAVDEITPVSDVKTVNGQPAIEHDDSIYPVLDLRERLAGAAPAANGDGMFLRIRETERPVALRCDSINRQEEVVTKPLEGELSDVAGVSGTAVVGDGQVVPIIDVVSL